MRSRSNLLTDLRTATSAMHERLDRGVIERGALATREGYVQFLRASLSVVAPIERALAAFTEFPIAGRADKLRSDLAALGSKPATESADEALTRAEDIRPHVTILDLGMPDMDGYAAARALRKRPWSREMVLYALTGWGQSKDRDRTRDAGFDHHFVKPLDVDELIEDLQSRLSARTAKALDRRTDRRKHPV